MRKHAQSKYPVGATWRATDWRGCTVTIWLDKITPTFEIWRWVSNYENSYGWTSDWGMSYESCKQHAPYLVDVNKKPVRYKRVA